jgi:HSP20 family molecular chaperone IbpA
VRHWAVPALDVFEREGDLRLVLSVPGVSLDRLTVEVEGGALTIAGARGDRPGHGWRRTLRLPDHVDATRVTAALRDGVLTLDLPRAEASKARRIEVRSA